MDVWAYLGDPEPFQLGQGGRGGGKRRYPWTIHECISEFVYVCVSTAAVLGKPDPCVMRGTISQKKT